MPRSLILDPAAVIQAVVVVQQHSARHRLEGSPLGGWVIYATLSLEHLSEGADEQVVILPKNFEPFLMLSYT